MKNNKQKLLISLGDASISVRPKEDFSEEENKKIMLSICALLRKNKWDIRVPYEDRADSQFGKAAGRRFACRYRKGMHSGLEFESHAYPAGMEFNFWENINDHSGDNFNGGKHIFNKESKMPFLTRMRLNLTRQKIVSHLSKYYDLEIKDKTPVLGSKRELALDTVIKRIKSSGHYIEELGRAEICMQGYNDKSRDGLTIKHKMPVYAVDYHGRIIKGIAYYDLNASWSVVTGLWDYKIIQARDIFVNKPEDIRSKQNERARRCCLEGILSEAISIMDFKKAQTIKDILFGNQPLFYIIKDGLYYRSSHSGYTSDSISAGKYTESEVESLRSNKALKIMPIYKEH